tara:strand:+ start:453 stop:1421 length:969 start_codon:yes stop_codon:yes gene_type:complete
MGKERRNTVLEMIDGFKGKGVLVIGDAILDINEYARVGGQTLEEPRAPKGIHERTEVSFGGAGNVVENLLELGARVNFVTVLGNDEHAERYERREHEKLKIIPIYTDGKNTVKRTTWIGDKKVLRLDYLDNRSLISEVKEQVIRCTEELVNESDVTLLVDYRHGMMSRDLIQILKDVVADNGGRAIASSQRGKNLMDYKGVYMICMNENEASQVYPRFDVTKGLRDLSKRLESNVCVTMGDIGANLYLHGGEEYESNRIEVEEVDSTGAGDSFLAALSLADIEGRPEESLYLANVWAGLSVGQKGTQVPSLDDLKRYVERNG